MVLGHSYGMISDSAIHRNAHVAEVICGGRWN